MPKTKSQPIAIPTNPEAEDQAEHPSTSTACTMQAATPTTTPEDGSWSSAAARERARQESEERGGRKKKLDRDSILILGMS